MYINEDIKYEKPDKFVQTCEVNNQVVTKRSDMSLITMINPYELNSSFHRSSGRSLR